MPAPIPPELTPFAGLLPDVNDPATWATRTPLFWNWVTGVGYENIENTLTYAAEMVDFVEAALVGSETLVDAVADLQTDFAELPEFGTIGRAVAESETAAQGRTALGVPHLAKAQVEDPSSAVFGAVSGGVLFDSLFPRGTWTPLLRDGAGLGPQSPGFTTGRYTICGKTVFFSFSITLTKGTSNSASQLRLIGLPGTMLNLGMSSFSPLNYFGFSISTSPMCKVARLGSGAAAVFLLRSGDDDGNNYYSYATLPSGLITLSGSGFYELV